MPDVNEMHWRGFRGTSRDTYGDLLRETGKQYYKVMLLIIDCWHNVAIIRQPYFKWVYDF